MNPSANRPPIPADGSVVSRAGELGTPGIRSLPEAARGAVIIPAHDEAGVIARTLRALAPLTGVDGVEVIVACNGCTDDTAGIARGFEGVTVVETDRASKIAGLNLGDDAATTWPRLYLDADIEISPHTVLAVFDALAEPGVLAARAFYVYDTIGATMPVRAYYRARSRVPVPASRLWGAGGYAATEEGHRRFGEFPHGVTADDSWFDGQFEDPEKRVVATSPMRVRTPRDTAGLLAVLTRQRRGYLELGISSHAASRGKGLLAAVRSPRDAVDVAWYMLLTVVSRRRADRILRQSERAWERDASSRKSIGEAP